MAVQTGATTIKELARVLPVGAFIAEFVIDIPSGTAQNDNVQVLEVPCGFRLFDAVLNQTESIGAAATAKLQHFDGDSTRVDLTAATTAAGADVERMTAAPMDLALGESIEILIAGGAPTAGTTIKVDLLLARK